MHLLPMNNREPEARWIAENISPLCIFIFVFVVYVLHHRGKHSGEFSLWYSLLPFASLCAIMNKNYEYCKKEKKWRKRLCRQKAILLIWFANTRTISVDKQRVTKAQASKRFDCRPKMIEKRNGILVKQASQSGGVLLGPATFFCQLKLTWLYKRAGYFYFAFRRQTEQ